MGLCWVGLWLVAQQMYVGGQVGIVEMLGCHRLSHWKLKSERGSVGGASKVGNLGIHILGVLLNIEVACGS